MSPIPEASSETRLILDSIRRIVRALRMSSRASEKLVGLSAAQLFVLQQLDEAHPVSVNELADRTLTHQSSVSVVVSRLVDLGFVHRLPSVTDRRRLELYLTPKGKRALTRAPQAAQEVLVEALEALSPKDRASLAGTLKTVVTAARFDIGEAAPLFFEEEPDTSRKKSGKSS